MHHWFSCILAAGILLLPHTGWGWLATTPEVFRKAFGDTQSATSTGDGLEVRQCRWRTITVTVLLQVGRPKQATYHMQDIDFVMINRLLAEHGDGRNWEVPVDETWNLPEQPPRRWVRADGAVELRVLPDRSIRLLDPHWQPPDTLPPLEVPVPTAPAEQPPERIPATPPPPQPARPAEIPTAGMSRQEVLQRYGSPIGRMTSGMHEVLLFPWGSVWFTGGQVVLVE